MFYVVVFPKLKLEIFLILVLEFPVVMFIGVLSGSMVLLFCLEKPSVLGNIGGFRYSLNES